METQPEKEISETTEDTPKESAEKLSPQGIASIQGNDVNTLTEKTDTLRPDAPATVDQNPPPEYQPATTDGTEKAGAAKIETGVEKPEKEHYSYKDNETGKPGSLKYNPSNPEAGG
jgi:hypothetical protein